MGLIATKPVFGDSYKARLKPVSSATQASYKIEISPVASLQMILSKKRITNALIRLRGCAGWSVPVLFANPPRQVFSRPGPYFVYDAPTIISIRKNKNLASTRVLGTFHIGEDELV